MLRNRLRNILTKVHYLTYVPFPIKRAKDLHVHG